MPQAEIQLDDFDSLISEVFVGNAGMRFVLPDFPDLQVHFLRIFQFVYHCARLLLHVFGLIVIAGHHGLILRLLRNFRQYMFHDLFGFLPLLIRVRLLIGSVEGAARRITNSFLKSVDL